jgi:hypothetical protein
VTYSFHCSACGACCNSAPQLSLPELFHHQERFIGCLAIRRIERPPLGQPWSVALGRPVDAGDDEAFDALAGELLEPVQGPSGPELVQLSVQAFDDPTRGLCPALAADKGCSLERDRKPSHCRAVPLEPLLPDSLQRAVLADREREAVYLGAHCIRRGTHPGFLPLLEERRVVAPPAVDALLARRRELGEDKRFWGSTVFGLLRAELFDHAERVGRLPLGGYFSMSLAPALAVVASASPRCRVRTVVFLNAQLDLIAENLGKGSKLAGRRRAELEGFLRASLALRSSLQKGRDNDRTMPAAPAVEAWLGLAAADAPIPTEPPSHPTTPGAGA